jgi:ABC-2 type transport system ATP-binding protein
VAGCDVVSDAIGVRRRSAVVFQEAVVDRPLTGRHNLNIHARLWRISGADVDGRVAAVVNAFGLGDIVDRPVATYSGGERRRLELARALLSEPEVLFLDEPTVGLDPRMRAELLDVIAGLRARAAMTIVLTTHYLDEAEELCDRVAIVHEGQVVALATPAALIERVGREIIEARVDGDAERALQALRARGVADDGAFVIGASVHVPLNGVSAREVTAAMADLGLSTSRITTRSPNLDDVYLQLTGRTLAA